MPYLEDHVTSIFTLSSIFLDSFLSNTSKASVCWPWLTLSEILKEGKKDNNKISFHYHEELMIS